MQRFSGDARPARGADRSGRGSRALATDGANCVHLRVTQTGLMDTRPRARGDWVLESRLLDRMSFERSVHTAVGKGGSPASMVNTTRLLVSLMVPPNPTPRR